MYAVAIDLGTTTLAASLIDRSTGRRIAMAGSLNPQRIFGSDLVSRLDIALHDEVKGLEMTRLVREEISRIVLGLIASAGVSPYEVSNAAVAGNPAMEHLLMGWSVRSLALPPFRPLQTTGLKLSPSELGWYFCDELYIFPQPGGFVGGDTVAFMFGLESSRAVTPAIYLDMGTNGEMVLDDGRTLWATSAAAGPAFEGGNLACGMVALPGAISDVSIDDGRLKVTVIGGKMPAGICGSAVINAVSMLLEQGLLDRSGRIRSRDEVSSPLAGRISELDGENLFVLHRDASGMVFISQSDIRQIQLAKAALRGGIEVLLEKGRIHSEALKQLILTGSFGAVLNPPALKTVGIFTEEMVKISDFVREGALAGVERALVLDDGFFKVENLARDFRVIPLSGTPLFERKFLEQIDFPD